MAFVPILDLLLFHTSSEHRPLYQHSKVGVQNKNHEYDTELLFGAIQTLRVFCSRLNEQKDQNSMGTLNISDSNKIYFNPLVSSFKGFKTPLYSLYFFETASGFQILLLVGQQEETADNITGPYCRADILDTSFGEGSQVILQHFYKNVIVDGIILDRQFIGLDFSGKLGKSWTQMAKEDLPTICKQKLNERVIRFFSELPKL